MGVEVNMRNDDKMLVRMYCPNCGKLLAGLKRDDGAVHFVCGKCQVQILSIRKTGRETVLKVKAGWYSQQFNK